MNKTKIISIFCIMLILLIPFYVSDTYAVDVEMPEVFKAEIPSGEFFEGEMGELIVEIGGYEPTVITSSVIEDQDVSVYANLVGIPTNPTLKIPKINRIITTVKGKNPYVLGNPRYHKPRIFSLTDLGYLEIRLKQIPKEEDVPDVIDINMSAKIYYDVEALTIGGEDTRSLEVVSEDEFFDNIGKYGFMGDKVFIRVRRIGTNDASFELFNSNKDSIGSFSLKEGVVSRVYNLVPGSDLMQDKIRLRLDSVKKVSSQVNLSIDDGSLLLLENDRIYGSNWKIDVVNAEDGYVILYKRGIDQAIILKEGQDISISDSEIKENLNLVKKEPDEKDVENFKESLEEFEEDISENFVVEKIIPAFEKNAKIMVGTSVGRYEEGGILVKDACEERDCTLTQIKDDRIIVEVPNEECDKYLTKSLRIDDDEDLHRYCRIGIQLKEIRTGKVVTVTILTGTGKGMTVSDFSLHLPIEKRFIKFAPEALDEKINKTKETIEKFEKAISTLDKVVKYWTYVCLAVGSVVAVGAFFGGFEKKEVVEKDVEKVGKIKECTYAGGGCNNINKFCYNDKCAVCSPGFYNCDGVMGCESTGPCGITTALDGKILIERKGKLLYKKNGEYVEYKKQPVMKDGERHYYRKGELKKYSGNFGVGEGKTVYKEGGSNEYIIPLRKDSLSSKYEYKYEKWKDEYGEGLFVVINSDERVVEVYSVGIDGKIGKNLISNSDDMFIEEFLDDEVYDAFEGKLRRISRAFEENRDSVIIEGRKFGLNSVIKFVPDMNDCEDIMDEKVCAILFNACDPVMCPPSRCNFGGVYQVDNVVQSGLVGSLMLCLPNFVGVGGDVVVPFCLSGILASLKVIKSYLEGYVRCLTAAKVEGKSVGICDKIRSIFVCETIWNEVMTFLNMKGGVIGLIVGKLFGGAKGGGEYLIGVGAGIEKSKEVVNYFVNSYATSAFAAYRGRSTKEIGTEFCKMAIYGKGPAFGEFFEQITTPQDPTQFTAFFEEQPWSVRTRESRYEVYYHIYAGAQEIKYSVFLRAENLPTEFVARSERLFAGEFADESEDLIASSGYQEICVEINGKIDCGFGKIVSTSFGVSRLGDYLVSHDLSRNIDSEAECRSEPAGGLFPNIAITRKCSAENPGRGLGPEVEQRWIDVGSCGEDKGRCWLEIGDLADAASRNDNPAVIRNSFSMVCEKQGGEVCKVGQICSEEGERIFLNTVISSKGDEVAVRCCSKGSCMDTKEAESILEEIEDAKEKLEDDEDWKKYQLRELDKAIEEDDFKDRIEDNFDTIDEAAGLANVRRRHPYEFFYFKGMNALRSGPAYCYIVKDILSCEDEDMGHRIYSKENKAVAFSCTEFEKHELFGELYDSYNRYCFPTSVDVEDITISRGAKKEGELKAKLPVPEPPLEEAAEEVPDEVKEEFYDAKLSKRSSDLTLKLGDEEELWVEFTNTGTKTWERSKVSLNILEEPPSIFEHSNWLTHRRPTLLDQDEVKPGGIGKFSFFIKIPEKTESGLLELRLKPVYQDNSNFYYFGKSVTWRIKVIEDSKKAFDDFVRYYKKCVSYTSKLPCSCGPFDHTKIPDGYRIELKQDRIKHVVEISLWEKRTLRQRVFGFMEIGKPEIIRGILLCDYVPSIKKMEVVDERFLGRFKIEKNMQREGGFLFSHEGNIFLMKYDRLHTCFPRVSNGDYNEFMKIDICK